MAGVLHSLGLDWMDPNYLLARFGTAFFWVSMVIIFIECGLLFPILPGDSLLFAIGLFSATGQIHVPLWTAIPLLMVAAFLGNVSGYEIGRAIGGRLMERDGRFIKRSHLTKTHEFFERYGTAALVLGRFVPIVRTFITLVAGVGRMERRTFLLWSGLGAVLWVGLVVGIGAGLGTIFPGLGDKIDVVILLIVLVSVVPMAIEFLRRRRAVRQR